LHVLPPCLQVAPSDAVASDGTVLDQDFVRVFDDLDVVVDGIAEPNVGFGQGPMRNPHGVEVVSTVASGSVAVVTPPTAEKNDKSVREKADRR
jgi:hypothetical protein